MSLVEAFYGGSSHAANPEAAFAYLRSIRPGYQDPHSLRYAEQLAPLDLNGDQTQGEALPSGAIPESDLATGGVARAATQQ